MNVLAYVIL